MTFDLINENRTGKDKAYNSNCLNRSMKKRISAADYFNSLKGIDAIQIREDYKKGIDLAGIIARYGDGRNNSGLTRVFDLIKFEFDEQERFLKTYETIDEVELFFFPLNQETYAKIIDATLKGMREGVEDFLMRSKAYSLYLSVIDDFCYDAAPKNIEKIVTKLGLPMIKKIISDYAVDVSGGYNFFLLNNSEKIFKRKFCKHKF